MKQQQPRLKVQKRSKRADEEIDSDEEEKLWQQRDENPRSREEQHRDRGKKTGLGNLRSVGDDCGEDDFEQDGFFYTEEENRVKLVKQYLKKLDLEEENDERKIHERLEREANQGNRNYHIKLADKVRKTKVN